MTETPLTRLLSESEETRKTKGTLHMPAEILQQPWLWRDTARRVTSLAERARSLLQGAEFVLVTGAGSSLHAGRMIEDSARARFGTAVSTVSCTDLMLTPERFVPKGRKGALLSLSRSGESPESVEAARIVAERFPDVAHMAVTCNAGGKLAKLVDSLPNGLCLALHEKSYDRGLGTTSSVTSTVVGGRFLVNPADPSGYAARVDRLARAGEAVLGRAALAERVARLEPDRVVVLGTGPLEAAAQEGAHKILELTDGQVPAMGKGYLEFRHGPIAFLNRRTVVVCLVTPERPAGLYELDFIGQLVEGGAGMEVVTVASGNPEVVFAGLDRHLWIHGADEADEVALLGLVFSQMFALFVSLRRGLTPDRPGSRGLVNPVVQGVTIYPRKEKA